MSEPSSAAAPRLIGRSPVFLQVVALIERMARNDAPVLIEGETGTGKELAARAIHYQSARRDAPFVPLNCGAIPEALIESELFGCERGAFTDARQARAGLVHAADGGTLFLDELDSLPQRAQVALLRFLQDYTYRPVGGSRECLGNVRIIAAASPRLRELLQSGAFRDDLAFRLNVLPLEMPPLRQRPGDARILAEHFIARHARQYGVAARQLHASSLDWLDSHSWPGNVRELDNCVQRALLLSDNHGAVLLEPPRPAAPPAIALRRRATDRLPPRLVSDFAALTGLTTPARPSDERRQPLCAYNEAREQVMQRFEREYLEQLMQATSGNVTHAARLAGKERRALGKLLKKHGLGHTPEPLDSRF